jgi:integrase
MLVNSTKGESINQIIIFAGMTGLRRSEIVNLRWEDVDLARKLIMVRNTESFVTKTGKMRTVPLNSTVFELLKNMPKSSEYVFPGDRGGRYNPNFLTERFREIVRENQLDHHLHFHSLRHTFASFLVSKGVSLYHVQKLLGHSNPRITQIYSHLSPNDMLPAVEEISL